MSNKSLSEEPFIGKTFGKDKRLLTQQMFQVVFDQAKFRVSHQHYLILARPNEVKQPRLGLVIGKKNIRLAVNRNRVKRLARETFRYQQVNLPALDIIFLARRGLDQADTRVAEILAKAWVKLSQQAQ